MTGAEGEPGPAALATDPNGSRPGGPPAEVLEASGRGDHRWPWPRPGLWRALGLRARVTVMFGLGALVLSMSMGAISYFTARHFLVAERQSASLHQAYVNASLIRGTLHTGSNDVEPLLVSADSGTAGSNSILYLGGTWYARSFTVNRSDLPQAFRTIVLDGTPATETFLLNGNPELAVGVPIPAVRASYIEVFDISDLSHTLRVLALALILAGFITTVLGAAIGRSASGRSLRPLANVSQVAVAIADGRLDSRLETAHGDPDLAGLTTSFNRMVEQLSERIDREARFTSDVSHELRSPLTTLSASLGVLEAHEDELSEPARHALTLLAADLHRFQRLVDDLLEISRSDTGSADVSLEEVPVAELVTKAVEANSPSTPDGVEPPVVVIDPDVRDAWLSVDKRRFERVVANLLENAAHYGGGCTRVGVTAGPVRADGRATVRLTIDDRGVGVAPGERSRVFERFYRGQASGRRGKGTGSGLGLALVAEHVRLNGGRVWVEEAPGNGARFVVELPVVDAAEWA